jgi:glycosyltransferase involved in cell wall biosynthesis
MPYYFYGEVVKILQINEVSSVANSLVEGLKEQGLDVYHEHLYDIHNGISINNNYFVRFFRAIKIIFKYGKRDVILHIHYLGNAVFFIFSKAKIVVHIHGSDIREPQTLIKKIINKIILRKSNIIFYSTPDIALYLRGFDKKASFLPSPIDPFFLDSKISWSRTCVRRIFFYAALSHIKGADIVLGVLKEVKSRHPDIEICTLNFGEYYKQEDAKYFTQMRKMKRSDLLTQLLSTDIVVGQMRVGAIGVSELEALALGKPVFAKFCYDADYELPCPIINVNSAEMLLSSLDELINNWSNSQQDILAAQRREWVFKNHGRAHVAQRVLGVYKNLIDI